MGHSPHGECGLKRVKSSQINHLAASLSSRGVWIETPDQIKNKPIKKSQLHCTRENPYLPTKRFS